MGHSADRDGGLPDCDREFCQVTDFDGVFSSSWGRLQAKRRIG
jgi:hypothetical protein